MELKILNACLTSRDFFDVATKVIDPTSSGYSKNFQLVYRAIADYYEADSDAVKVDPALLSAQLGASKFNDKHKALLETVVKEAFGVEGASIPNLRKFLLEIKKFEVKTKLSLSMINGHEREERELLAEYNELLGMEQLEEDSEDGSSGTAEVHTNFNVHDLLANDMNTDGWIKLYPLSLNAAVGGGVPPETHVLAFGRPESGKTALAITLACGFAYQGYKGIYFGNEDPVAKLKARLITCLTGMTIEEIRRDPELAQRRADAAGLANITLVSLAPGTLEEVEQKIIELEAQWVVVDQTRNLNTFSDSRVNQLETAAQGVRDICKKHKLKVAVSLTQAGDSAANKAQLDMGDVDFSNTGMPAAADIMLGVGVTSDLEGKMERCISLPKNKNNGNHVPVYVRINPFTSRIKDL